MGYSQKPPRDISLDTRVCEVCGVEKPNEKMFALPCGWLVTGHPLVPSFACSETNGTFQHWGCSAEHAVQATVQCLQTSMLDQIDKKHNEANGSK